MGDASNAQADFRGGEWSPYAQGAMGDREYHRGLNVCRNGYPIEEGAWTRRQGTRFAGYTKGGGYGWLVPFHFSQSAPYNAVFTDQSVQFLNGVTMVMTNDPKVVVSISTANPAKVKTLAAHGWANGDFVQLLLSDGIAAPNAGAVMDRQFKITVTSSTEFTIQDALTSANIDGSTFSVPTIGVSVGRLNTLASPYVQNQLSSINSVIAEILVNNALQGQLITLHPTVKPQVIALTNTPGGVTFANFSINAATFVDGPYFDPQPTGTLIASALTGTITITGAPAGTFVSTDVGRQMRLFSEPPLWSSATAYVTGNNVEYQGVVYTALKGSTNFQPDVHFGFWSVNPTGTQWAWGTITAVDSDTQVHFAINSASANLLYGGSSNAIRTWRLGVYSDTTGYPTCGVFHEGRLWLGGAQPNRFDASVSNSPFSFSPTASDGTVADNNAISYIFNSDDVNKIVWMTPDHQGIVCGTAGGEWLIQSAQQGDPISPTSIQAHRVTKYKASSVPPTRTGLALLFVQAQARRLLEYTSSIYSGKFSGRNLSEKARHLSGSGIAQIAYQQDLAPIVWSRMNDGSLAGMTYKRESEMPSEPPVFAGWHRHDLGSGRVIESISAGPNVDGTLETLVMITNDPVTNIRHIEVLTDMFDETTDLVNSWFLDDAVAPTSVIEDTTNNTVKLFGMNHLAGKTVSVVAAGLDLGDYAVASDGTVTIPLGGTAQSATVGLGLPLFTDAFFSAFVGTPSTAFSVLVNRVVTVRYAAPVTSYIQGYIDTSVVTGVQNRDWMQNDFIRNELWQFSAANTSPSGGFIAFDRFTGAKKRAVTQGTLFSLAANPPVQYASNSNFVQGPFTQDDDGYIYWNSTSTNAGVIRKMHPTNLNIVASFGVAGSSFTSDNNQIFGGVSTMVTTKVWQEAYAGIGFAPKPAGFRNFLVACASAAHGIASDISVLAVDDVTNNNVTTETLPDGHQYQVPTVVAYNKMQWAGARFTVDEDLADCVRGDTYTNGKLSFGNIWVVGHAKAASLPGTAALGIYKIQINAAAAQFDVPPGPTYGGIFNQNITKTKTGTIAPSAIDGTWTNFSTVRGLAFDKTNNYLIFWVQTTNAVTNKQYIVGVNPNTATVVWTTPINATAFPPDFNWQTQYYIGYGTLAWLGAGGVLNSVTTAAGILVTTNVPGITGAFGSFSDDRDGQTFFSGGYTSGAGAPVGLNGTVSYGTEWGRLGNVNGFSGQTSITTDYNFPVMPMCVGFTYTSQGQRLRPVAPEESGARNGPAFAKTRRNHKTGFQLANAQAISICTQFTDQTKVRPLILKSDRVTTNAIDSLFTGVERQEVDDDNSYDGMVGWQISRPYPCTVTAVGGFIHTQDI